MKYRRIPLTLKAPVFVDREAVDLMGTHLSPGDVLAYSSKHAMRIAVYLGILINKKKEHLIGISLVDGDSPDGHIIMIPVDKVPTIGPNKTVVLAKGILIDLEFHVNNRVIQNTIQVIDHLKDEGILK